MSTISFKNPGLIDMAAVTTLGVNIKEGPSPIGYFGTGLKYALAVLLREGCSITIWRGQTPYEFSLQPREIRGKTFQLICMNGEALGFTSDLGKNWGLEQAYRELHCNCVDENGSTFADKAPPEAGTTTIEVSGPAFHDIYLRRFDFILNPERKPIYESELVDVYSGAHNQIFYRGIAVGKLDARGCSYTYNFKAQLPLTEDRVVANAYIAQSYLSDALAKCEDENLLRVALGNQEKLEPHLSWTWVSEVTPQFAAVLESFAKEMKQISPGLRDLRHRTAARKPGQKQYREAELNAVQQDLLRAAIMWCKAIGFEVDNFPIICSNDMPSNILGLASREENSIYLNTSCFETNDQLRSTLIEEYVHLTYNVDDRTLAMQNVLFKEILRLGHALTS